MSSHLEEEFTKIKASLRAEAKDALERPFYSKAQTLYDLHDLKSLESDETKRTIKDRWNHNLDRPEFGNFKDAWMKAEAEERKQVEYQYCYWYREILILEKIAELNNITLQRTRKPYTFSDPYHRQM